MLVEEGGLALGQVLALLEPLLKGAVLVHDLLKLPLLLGLELVLENDLVARDLGHLGLQSRHVTLRVGLLLHTSWSFSSVAFSHIRL